MQELNPTREQKLRALDLLLEKGVEGAVERLKEEAHPTHTLEEIRRAYYSRQGGMPSEKMSRNQGERGTNPPEAKSRIEIQEEIRRRLREKLSPLQIHLLTQALGSTLANAEIDEEVLAEAGKLTNPQRERVIAEAMRMAREDRVLRSLFRKTMSKRR